jgi:hypothetical protein
MPSKSIIAYHHARQCGPLLQELVVFFEVPMQKPFDCWFFFLKKLVRNFDYGLYPDVVLSDDSVLIGCFFNPLNDAFIKFKEHSVTYEPSSTKKFPIGNLFEIYFKHHLLPLLGPYNHLTTRFCLLC